MKGKSAIQVFLVVRDQSGMLLAMRNKPSVHTPMMTVRDWIEGILVLN
jgi:hypothetical protein